MASEKKAVTLTLRVSGMHCPSCEILIRDRLLEMAGVESVAASYAAGTVAVVYDPGKATTDGISAAIRETGYDVLPEGARPRTDLNRALGMVIIIAAIYIVLQQFGLLNYLVPSRLADTDMSYWFLFVIGLFTSVHCVAMCGGINLSQCLPRGGAAGIDTAKSDAGSGGKNKKKAKTAAAPARSDDRFAILRPSILYNLGRVISYTIVGFAAGAVGSAVTFSITAQGVLKLVAGVFMILMGISMLDLFPWARRLVPRMPKFVSGKVREGARDKGPLIVGLLNGLMPCGPLQAVQLYALSTGSPVKGAISMLLFSLGTVPLMFGLGTFSSAAGKKYTRKVMTAGAVMVAVLGLCMLSQGWYLFGPASLAPRQEAEALDIAIDRGPQVINSTLAPYNYPSIRVESGRPVKWVINAPPGSINGCNYKFIIREYGIVHEFKPGDNVIEFTPSRVGNIPYTCWMGMIPGMITVASAGEVAANPSGSAPQSQSGPQRGGAGCCNPGPGSAN
jgi:sulfite exporter TauE/SafE/copper chaperone CopZ